MHPLTSTISICLFIIQTIQYGRSLECKDKVFGPILNDTTPANVSLFSIDGFIDFVECPIKSYFGFQNSTIYLKQPLSSYCGDLTCRFRCQKNAKTAINSSLILSISRLGNYSIQFMKPIFRLNVTENRPIGSNILQEGFSVTIKECQVGKWITNFVRGFGLINNTDDLFEWKPQSSNDTLLVKNDIDYERYQTVSLTLKTELTNQGRLFSTATTTLEISVLDVDDNPPKFEYSEYTANITEKDTNLVNTTLQTFPGQVHAFDMDTGVNEEIVYSIQGDRLGLFTIDSSSGDIQIAGTIDREKHEHYKIVIKAAQRDKDYSSATVSLLINVTDVDDNLPVFCKDTYTASLSEHAAAGSYIARVKAVDEDSGVNAMFSFRLLNDSVPVYIDDDGILRVKNENEFDRDILGDKIIIQVQTVTYDNITGQDMKNVTILLEDINDNNPQFTRVKYHFAIDNNTQTTVIGKVEATDRDKGPNANVTFSFMAGTESQTGCGNDKQAGKFPFTIDSISGNISIISHSITLCSQYSVFVKGCDNPAVQSESRCVLSEVLVTSSGVTNGTEISRFNQTLKINENLGVDVIVGKLYCIGSTYKYSGDTSFYISRSLIDGNFNYLENKRTNTGILMANQPLDREANETHSAIVEVENENGDVFCRINLTVSVLDANDNAPMFENDEYNFVVPEDNIANLEVGRVKANDFDKGTNGEVLYFLKHSGDFQEFWMNSTSGAVHFKGINSHTKDIYFLLVGAEDKGKPPLGSVASVIITKPGIDNVTIPLSTPLTTDEILERKDNLEKAMSLILKRDITISSVRPSTNTANKLIKSVIYVAGSTNGSATVVTKAELQRLLLANYEAIRALFYQGLPESKQAADSQTGLRAPEIALIVMAAVILLGAIIAIIIINKQFSSHKKYRRLYENLTRNSSIYESQEIKVNLDDDTSDYCEHLNNGDSEETENKVQGTAIAYTNPLFSTALASENDSGNVSDINQETEGDEHAIQRNRSDSEQALESLSRLADLLDKEDDEPNHTANIQTLNPESIEIIDTSQNSAEAQTYEPVSSKILTDLQDDQDRTVNSNENSAIRDLQTPQTETKPKDNNSYSEQVIDTNEPNPDYDIKQVRFSAEVLDTDDNKFEPLKESEEGRKYSKRIDSDGKTGRGVKSEEVSDDVFDDDALETQYIKQKEETDELGWVEEEINSPNTSVSLDDIDKAEIENEQEASTHF